ncbi:OmpA family protein [Planctomicrobium sp. SH664]|uniref:OmpA/MotB family protein n=1 Tax=Planctomicrobium sp. SH664 TaxID=3448125 RepID=UPI003F5BF730
MSRDMRKLFALAALGSLAGCCHQYVPQSQLRQAQLRTYQVYRQGEMYMAQLGEAQQLASQMQTEKQLAEQRASELEKNLAVANSRLNNLAQERSKLHNEYKNLLTSLPSPGSPANGSINAKLQDLCRKYPQFEFDPISGVCRFNGDLLFSSGSNQIRPEGLKVLQEFTGIMNSSDAKQFNILVVGHTDDQPIVTPATRAKHETNWELSAHRATAVVRQLGKYGVAEPRMGIAGYNKFQPAASNVSDSTRQKNRRVEIFILGADSSIASKEGKPIQ